ncbi:MAG: glycosyltransferase [Desulfopila sp.]
MNNELTIIVPVFDEEESLPAFFTEFDRLLASSPLPLCALLINDGSRDGSLQLIRDKCQQSPAYTFISLDRNHGLSTAIKAGFDHCQTELVGYIDADLQTNPTDFISYFQYFPEFDMVNGIRSKRQDGLIKRLSSKFANGYRRLMIDDGIVDTCCPLKIMKSEYARAMPFFTGMHRFMPALVQLQGGRVKQLPVAHYPRHAGTAKYHLLNRLVGPFFDTLAFRWMRSRYIRYGVAEKMQ